jgi:hypothetical protein
MAADITAAHVPDHHTEDIHICPEDMRALGTIRWTMTEELSDIVATAIPLGGAVLLPDAVALCL